MSKIDKQVRNVLTTAAITAAVALALEFLVRPWLQKRFPALGVKPDLNKFKTQELLAEVAKRKQDQEILLQSR